METLYERAFAQEGEPIRRNATVLVELVDAHGTVVESRNFTREDSVDDLREFVGAYTASMVAEAMDGTVRWSANQPEIKEAGHDV